MTTERNEVKIFWSAEDGAFVADVPELLGCMAHGGSCDEALARVRQAMTLGLDFAVADGQPVPGSRGQRLTFA